MDGSKPGFIIRLLTWLGGHELAVLIGFASAVAGALAFVVVADQVHAGSLQNFDRTLLVMFRRPPTNAPIGPPTIQEAVRDITAMGGVVVLGFVTVVTAGFLVLDGKSRMALLVLASAGGGLCMNLLLKDAFHRPRPQIVPHLVYASGESFPSGHSMLSATIYLTLGALLARSHKRKRLKAYFLLVAGLLTVMIGVSRVYLGVHWPTDVLAGWTAGSVWALLCWLVARSLQSNRTVEPEAENAEDSTRRSIEANPPGHDRARRPSDHFSRTTSFGFLSSLSPINRECRRWPSGVHSTYSNWHQFWPVRFSPLSPNRV
jgi:undecaprenyl-diphosphatase